MTNFFNTSNWIKMPIANNTTNKANSTTSAPQYAKAVCDHCLRIVDYDEILKTVYGDYICEDCWDNYINSDSGLAEYFVRIANGDGDPRDFCGRGGKLQQIIDVWAYGKLNGTLGDHLDINKIEQDFIDKIKQAGITVNLTFTECLKKSISEEFTEYDNLWN
jgi:hypothetical protein